MIGFNVLFTQRRRKRCKMASVFTSYLNADQLLIEATTKASKTTENLLITEAV